MRVLHTADWHLGRVYHGVSLLEDQAAILDQLPAVIRDARPDAVIVAGDLYDRSVPPGDAVRLLDETLTRLVCGCRIPVIVIAGNHDGADRLGFGARLLEAAGLTLRSTVSAACPPVVLRDRHGEVAFYPLPYAEPPLVRAALGDDSLADHHRCLAAQTARLGPTLVSGRRQVAIAHAFVQGGSVSESERPLSVGGTGAVGAEAFAGFHYVALGHLHRPQSLEGQRLNYSGSLLKYSFSEVDHRKSLSLVDLDGHGGITLERIALTPRRDLRMVGGTLAEILAAAAADPHRDDYILARLDDPGALLDAMGKLRAAYPNALAIERPLLAAGRGVAPGQGDHRQIATATLFADFYREMTGGGLSAEASAVLATEIEQGDREPPP